MPLVNISHAAFPAYLNEVLVEHFVGKPLRRKNRRSSPTSTAGG